MRQTYHILVAFLLLTLLPLTTQAEKINLSSADDTTKSTTLRSPTGALFRSIAFPAWGQLYNKKYPKATVVFLGESGLITGAVIEWVRMKDHQDKFESLSITDPQKAVEFDLFEFHQDKRNIFLWLTAATIFLSMWDAYADAQLSSFEKEKKEEQNQLGFVPSINRENKEFKLLWSFKF